MGPDQAAPRRASAPDVPASALVRGKEPAGGPHDREPSQQVEIQLGHLCNNRCVFCVSGQRTARGQAGVSSIAPIVAMIRDARARGHDKITLLGGEPTLQPGFLDILRECAALGFSEVVVFTNGAKTASGTLIDQALATGAKVSFRISIQGATEESHERTTLKPGSFDRIVRTLGHLKERGLKTTVNMCLVASNHEDVHHFAALLGPFGVRQLHVDLMRPRDAGDRTEAELRTTLAPLDRVGASLTRMVEAFDPGFDVNVGNLPFCLAPSIADRIHHDGEATETIAIDGGDAPSAPWDKYENKRRDKVKPARCAECVFDAQCTGVYEHYLRLHGDAAIQPVSPAAIAAIDPKLRWTALHAAGLIGRLERAARRDGVTLEVIREGLEAARLQIRSVDRTEVRLVSPRREADARHPAFAVQRLASGPVSLAWLAAQLEDEAPVVPLIDPSSLGPSLRAAWRRLREAAPFGALRWTRSAVRDGALVLTLSSSSSAAEVTLGLDAAAKVALRYRLIGPPDDALREGLRSLLAVLDAR